MTPMTTHKAISNGMYRFDLFILLLLFSLLLTPFNSAPYFGASPTEGRLK